MVFRLLKRTESLPNEPTLDVGWAGRLHAIGRALDDFGEPLRDLAISITGYDVWITARGYSGGMYRGVWAPLTFRVEDHGVEYVAAEPDRFARPRPIGWSVVKPAEPWVTRLRALGVLLDRAASSLRDILILDVDGGFVVQGLIQAETPDGERWVGTTGEVTAKEIAAVSREMPLPAKVRLVHLRTLGLG